MNQNQLEMLRENFAIHNGGVPFEHFYCPIQLRETDEELCDGHVVTGKFGNSQETIIQVANVDNFFGTKVEAKFLSGAKALGTADEDIIRDGGQHVETKIMVDDEKVGHYNVDKPKVRQQAEESESQSVVKIPDSKGDKYAIGINLSEADICELVDANAKFEMISSCDFRAEAVGSILHSAHLTMFAILKYQYVFSSGGVDMAKLLSAYYEENKNLKKNPKQLKENTQNYFLPYENRVRILAGSMTDHFKGTIEDKFFVAWVSSSDRYIAFGVFVKTGDVLHIVWMFGGDAECAAEFVALEREHPQEMRVKLMRFHQISDHEVKVAVDPEVRTWRWLESEEKPSF